MAGQMVLILWIAGASMQPSLARAQTAMTLEPGKRVRVFDSSLGRDPVIGRFDGLRGDTLTFSPDYDRFHTLQVVLDRESRVDISIAHHNHTGRGLLTGGVNGLAFGAAVVFFQQLNDPQPQQEVSNAPIVAGAAIGAVVGGAVGASIPSDAWVTVRHPKPVSFGMELGVDGPHLMVSASF